MISPKIKAHFKQVDPVLFSLIDQIELIEREPSLPEMYFEELCDAIVSQQLAGKAAETIFMRFKGLFPKGQISSKKVLKLKDEQLRGVGLSGAKAAYIKDLAQKVESKELKLGKLPNLSDEEVIEELIKVKGIGRWTAEMFLIFSLGREDVFSKGDLGLVNAVKKLYKISEKPTLEELEKISARWSPHRSLASRILWKSLTLK
jgi:DNA-3-methyladenine glycosylase II